jgi:hypothetical protein
MKPEQLDALIRYRIEQAHETLREAEILFGQSAVKPMIMEKISPSINLSPRKPWSRPRRLLQRLRSTYVPRGI